MNKNLTLFRNVAFLTIFFIYEFFALNAQTSILNLSSGELRKDTEKCEPSKSITYFDNGVSVEYNISTAVLSNHRLGSDPEWQLSGFQNILGDGLPSVPVRADHFFVPSGYKIKLKIIEEEYVECNTIIAPAIPFLTDSESYPKILSPINSYNGFFPHCPVEISRIRQQDGYDIVSVNVSPILYNQKDELARIYTHIKYSLETAKESNEKVFTQSQEIEDMNYTLKLSKEGVLSGMGITPLLNSKKSDVSPHTINNGIMTPISQPVPGYLIITTSSYKTSAEKFASWKRALGFNVSVRYSNVWTIERIQNLVNSFVNSDPLSLKYCLILGNSSDVPTIEKRASIAGDTRIWQTDLPYFCTSGEDKLPEVKFGRIPVKSADEAEIAISKIISYERTPPQNEHFYNSIHLDAIFQDTGYDDPMEADNGYEDRRFCQTTQEMYEYLTTKCNKNVDRVYYYYLEDLGEDSEPTNWSTIFSNGEPLPIELRKENFNWWPDDVDGKNELLNGYSLIAYRGHGSYTGWTCSCFSSYHTFRDAKNGDLLPFILSICCNTGHDAGKHMPNSVLCNSQGGGIGMIASSSESFSGPNELLSHGFIDALWPVPGLRTSMSYNDPEDNWECLPFEPTNGSPIYEAFDAFQKALYRMEAVFPTIPEVTDYTREEYCLYGDPAMYLYTANPYSTKQGNISCNIVRTESSVEVSNIKSSGVVSIYDTHSGEIKRYVGATSISYPTTHPQKTIITIREPNKLLFYNKGSEVSTTY